MLDLIQEETHCDRRVRAFTRRPRHLNDMLAHTVRHCGDREAVIDDARRFTDRDLIERGARVAAGLAAAGIRPGAALRTRIGAELRHFAPIVKAANLAAD